MTSVLTARLSKEAREARRQRQAARVLVLYDGQPALHLVHDGEDYAVWLDPAVPETGLIVGLADTREGAIADAVQTLETMVEALQGPSREDIERAKDHASDPTSPVIHGRTCEKAPHVREGYLHDASDDTPYDVDGVRYCGRCHLAL